MSRLYVRVMTGFYTHRKTVKLRMRLGSDAYWIPPRLWAYCAENQADGDLSKYTSEELAELIGCPMHATSMLQALKDCGFIDIEGFLHGWDEHNGYHEKFAVRAKKAADARWAKEKPPTPPKEEERGKRKVESGDKHCSSIASSISPSSSMPAENGFNYIPPIESALKWLEDWRRSGADYTEQETRSAFLALSATGWMWGRNPVTDHRAALERQIQTDRNKRPQNGFVRAADRPKTIFELKTIKEAKEQLAASLKLKHAAEGALETTWTSDIYREEYRKLKREIKTITEQIGKM